MTDEFYVADTEYGQVRGVKVISEVGIPYWRFLGIPYAKPPVGELRFQKAFKASPWDRVLDALKEPPPCAGKNNYTKTFIGTDDCLYLNIYTKNLKPEKSQAVFVYVFGGGFSTGSSSLSVYSPDYLLMHDIVIVIFNYRLGPLGFLSLDDKNLSVPGNAGQKDQQMVLEFVRDNIRNFGGDPSNVTLVGHSSGGISVGLHCLSESSQGLFNRAIIMGASPIFTVAPQLNWAKRLAVKLGFDQSVDDEEEILRFLQSAEVLKLAEAATSLVELQEYQKYGFMFPFAPVVEPYLSESTFLSKDPLELIENAWSKDIDILIGGSSDEGVYFRFLKKITFFESEIPYELRKQMNENKLKEVAQRFEEVYKKDSEDTEKMWANILGDTFIWLPIARFIKNRQNSAKGKTFVHKFEVDSPTQNHYRNRNFGPGSKGVIHADELSYMWKNTQGGVPPEDSMEFRAIKRFTSILTNFVQSGNPGIAEFEPINDFPPKVLSILPDELKFGSIEEFERIHEFWEKIYEEVGVKFC